MGFYRRIALALALVYLFGDSILGAPDRGRYQWVRCKPDGRNANCVEEKGPLMEMTGLSHQLPHTAIKDIVPVTSSRDTMREVEQSGEGSGDLGAIAFSPVSTAGLIEQQIEQQSLELDGSGETDSNHDFPEGVKEQLPEADLKQDNMIQ